MKFSARLKNLLKEHNLTQRKFAGELNIVPSTLNGYLRQDREPDYDTLISIADFFQVSTDYLLGVTEIRRPSYPSKCYDDKEQELLDAFRSLGPQEQSYLIRHAHIYDQQDLDTPDSQGNL